VEFLSEDSINKLVLPHLSHGMRGPKAPLRAIVYKLKTGCQWRLLPVRELLGTGGLHWQGAYHHFRKWAACGGYGWSCCGRNVACSTSIECVLQELAGLLEEAGIAVEGLFLNVDAGFDSQSLRKQCIRLG
jgi:transposase